MNTHAFTTDPAVFDRLRTRALMVGIAGLIAGGIGAILQPSQFWPSWLIGFMFCVGMTVGSLAMLMLQHMVGGLWGMAGRRIFEAASRLLPYCILLFIPIAFALPKLYIWAHPDAVRADEVLRHKAFYFQTWFFLLRAAMLALLIRVEPYASFLRPVMFHDIGKLMLAFIMLWAYFSFSQFLIIWAGNLPEEIPFYLARMRYGWGVVSLIIIFGHFVLPFCFLLSRELKRRPKRLAQVAWFIVAIRFIDLIWLVAPEFNQGTMWFPVSLANIGLPIGLFGIWVYLFAGQLRSRALLPANDPYFKEMLAHGHTGH